MKTITIDITVEGEKNYGQSLVRKYKIDESIGEVDWGLVVEDMVITIEEADAELTQDYTLDNRV